MGTNWRKCGGDAPRNAPLIAALAAWKNTRYTYVHSWTLNMQCILQEILPSLERKNSSEDDIDPFGLGKEGTETW